MPVHNVQLMPILFHLFQKMISIHYQVFFSNFQSCVIDKNYERHFVQCFLHYLFLEKVLRVIVMLFVWAKVVQYLGPEEFGFFPFPCQVEVGLADDVRRFADAGLPGEPRVAAGVALLH